MIDEVVISREVIIFSVDTAFRLVLGRAIGVLVCEKSFERHLGIHAFGEQGV